MTISIGSDHAGYELKEKLKEALSKKIPGLNFNDVGTKSLESVDYPDFADLVAADLKSKKSEFGILICGSGQGMAMRANKYPQVRAALVYNSEVAKLAREHNDANVICLGARFIDMDSALLSTITFLNTKFEGGRHAKRVDKIGKSC